MSKEEIGMKGLVDGVELSRRQALRRVEQALGRVVNGETIVKVQGGKPIWVDKFERERVG